MKFTLKGTISTVQWYQISPLPQYRSAESDPRSIFKIFFKIFFNESRSAVHDQRVTINRVHDQRITISGSRSAENISEGQHMKKSNFLLVSLKMGYLHEFNSDWADQIRNKKEKLSSFHCFNKIYMLSPNHLVKNCLKGRVSQKVEKIMYWMRGENKRPCPLDQSSDQKNTLEIFIFIYFHIFVFLNCYKD